MSKKDLVLLILVVLTLVALSYLSVTVDMTDFEIPYGWSPWR